MAKNKYARSTSLERRVQGYLKPRTFMMFEAERTYLLRGDSEHVQSIIEKHYESLTPSHQRQLLDIYEQQIKDKK